MDNNTIELLLFAALGIGALNIALFAVLLYYIIKKLGEAANIAQETIQDIQHKIEGEINTVKREIESTINGVRAEIDENVENVRRELHESLDQLVEEVQEFKEYIENIIHKITHIRPWDLVVDSVKNIFR
jgi:gas vesicle protein